MKRIFSISCIAFVVGLVFYLTYNGSSTLKATPSVSASKISEVKKSVPAKRTTSNTPSPKKKTKNIKNDPCSCCRKSLEIVKKRRQALENWARNIIAHHGYEDGMKRVTSISPILAKRMQQILEKENNDPISGISQQNQQKIPHAKTPEQKTPDK